MTLLSGLVAGLAIRARPRACNRDDIPRVSRHRPSVFSPCYLPLASSSSAGETLIGSNPASIRGASSYHSLSIDPIGEIEFGAAGKGGKEEEEEKKRSIRPDRPKKMLAGSEADRTKANVPPNRVPRARTPAWPRRGEGGGEGEGYRSRRATGRNGG